MPCAAALRVERKRVCPEGIGRAERPVGLERVCPEGIGRTRRHLQKYRLNRPERLAG